MASSRTHFSASGSIQHNVILLCKRKTSQKILEKLNLTLLEYNPLESILFFLGLLQDRRDVENSLYTFGLLAAPLLNNKFDLSLMDFSCTLTA